MDILRGAMKGGIGDSTLMKKIEEEGAKKSKKNNDNKKKEKGRGRAEKIC